MEQKGEKEKEVEEEEESLLFSLFHYHFLFQDPFNVVKYRLIGDDSAPTYFSLDENSGNIAVQPGVELVQDSLTEYTVSYSRNTWI